LVLCGIEQIVTFFVSTETTITIHEKNNFIERSKILGKYK